MADFGIGAAILGSSLVSGISGFLGNRSAGKASQEAAGTAAAATDRASERALESQERMFQTARADTAPYRDVGRLALGELTSYIENPATLPSFAPGSEFTSANRYDPSGFQNPNEFRFSDDIRAPNEFRFSGDVMAANELPKFSLADLETDPEYTFRQQETERALERAQSARGLSLSGGAMRELSRYSQGLAASATDRAYQRFIDRYNARAGDIARRAGMQQVEDARNYEDVLRRGALQQTEDGRNYQDFLRRQQLGQFTYGADQDDLRRRYAAQADIYNANVSQANQGFNRLASLAGLGQTSAGQIAGLGAQTGANMANVYGQQGAALGNIAIGAGQGQANAALGTASAVNNAVQGGIGNYLTSQYLNRLPIPGAS